MVGVLMIGNTWFGAMSHLLSSKTNLLNSVGGLTMKKNIVDLCKALSNIKNQLMFGDVFHMERCVHKSKGSPTK